MPDPSTEACICKGQRERWEDRPVYPSVISTMVFLDVLKQLPVCLLGNLNAMLTWSNRNPGTEL